MRRCAVICRSAALGGTTLRAWPRGTRPRTSRPADTPRPSSGTCHVWERRMSLLLEPAHTHAPRAGRAGPGPTARSTAETGSRPAPRSPMQRLDRLALSSAPHPLARPRGASLTRRCSARGGPGAKRKKQVVSACAYLCGGSETLRGRVQQRETHRQRVYAHHISRRLRAAEKDA